MDGREWSGLALALGLLLSSAPLLQLAWREPAPPPRAAGATPFVATSSHVRATRRGAADAALREAAAWRTMAGQAAREAEEELGAWDPAAAGPGAEACRRRLAYDCRGYLRRARRAARRAAALARSPTEARRAAALLARLEREARGGWRGGRTDGRR